MTRFERGNDALGARQMTKCRQRFLIGDGLILRAPAVLEPRVLRADAGIIETGGNRMRLFDLTAFIVHEIGAIAVQHTRAAGRQGRRVAAGGDAVTTRFDTDQAHARIIDEGIEQANRIRPAADAGNQGEQVLEKYHMNAAAVVETARRVFKRKK